MKISVLNNIADKDSITTNTNTANGITNYYFSVNGARIEAQSDIDNSGLYGFALKGIALLTLLNRDEHGNPEETK